MGIQTYSAELLQRHSIQMQKIIKKYMATGYDIEEYNSENDFVMEKELEPELKLEDGKRIWFQPDSNIVRADILEYEDERHGRTIKINLSFPTAYIDNRDPITGQTKHFEYGTHYAFLEYDLLEDGGFELRSVRSRGSKNTERILRR